MTLMPPARPPRIVLGAIDPRRVEGRNYLIRPRPSKGWASEARAHSRGTLTTTKTESMLVILGLAEDDTPEGLAAAVHHVTVFEVTPA
jgi:hypothetical protein